MKAIAKKILRKLGYNGSSSQGNFIKAKGFKLFQYLKNDGSFDYERYKKIQQEGNIKRIEYSWVIEENIKFLSEYLTKSISPISFGICHGTRRGDEQKWFQKFLACEVIGTEISDTAANFTNTIQWDFHKENPEWINRADFIYSNSFDHSYDPEACITAWIKSLRIGGLCILEHSNLHAPEGASELDPFGADIEVMPYLLTKWAKGNFFVREILEAPERNPMLKYLQFLVIERRE